MAANGSGVQVETIRNILVAWVLTPTCAILLSVALYFQPSTLTVGTDFGHTSYMRGS